ncbi:MAG: helix-turn-helix domain-containing protein [Clostridia bacterium]|nr:helix-turn-helix domain-containing protein [Clostridia bacterium]
MVVSKKNLGELIKKARSIKSQKTGEKYTQAMLADDLGISRSYLSDIENGRTYPNYVLLNRISQICHVSLNFFSEQENHRENPEQDTPPLESLTPEIRRIARAGGKLSKEQAQTLLKVAQTLFPEAFHDED